MLSRFLFQAKPATASDRAVQTAARSEPRTTFRPPTLMETAVKAEPFVRVGPRLRNLEIFSRELSS